MKSKIDTKELNKLLDQVAEDVTNILAKAEEDEAGEKLAKASPGEEAPGEETPAGSSTEGSEPEGSPDEGPEGSAGDQPPPEGASEGADQDPAADEVSGPEALQAEYAKLPIEELKLHVMAAHAALMQAVGDTGAEGAPQEGAPEGAPPEAAPGVSPEATQSMGKAEIKSCEGNGGQIKSGGKMAKSEKSDLEIRIETLEKSLTEKDATIADLEAKFGKAAEGLKTFVEKKLGVGLRKSIAGVSFDAKPGEREAAEFQPMAKSEAVKKLNELTASKDLKKSDRELITSYVIGNADQSTVAHLLK